VKKILFIIILFIISNIAYAGQTYVWTDENGETHFSKTEPEARGNTAAIVQNSRGVKGYTAEGRPVSPEDVQEALRVNTLGNIPNTHYTEIGGNPNIQTDTNIQRLIENSALPTHEGEAARRALRAMPGYGEGRPSYKVYVKRLESNLYKDMNSGATIKTSLCLELAIGEEAVLMWDGINHYACGKLIFSNTHAVCQVDGVYK